MSFQNKNHGYNVRLFDNTGRQIKFIGKIDLRYCTPPEYIKTNIYDLPLEAVKMIIGLKEYPIIRPKI